MNMKFYKHPDAPEIRETRDQTTARALQAAGWVEIKADAPVVKAGEAKK